MSSSLGFSEIGNEQSVNFQHNNNNKRRNRNSKRTLKRRERQEANTKENRTTNDEDTKVNSLLDKLHKMEDSDSDLGDFDPPPMPESSGVERRRLRSNNLEANDLPGYNTIDTSVTGNAIPSVKNQSNINDPPPSASRPFPNVPYYTGDVNGHTVVTAENMQGIPIVGENVFGEGSDVLMEKINYLIHLLEEQHDEKIGNVTEELILYGFLGIFVIFVVDSFARAGKYVR
jgi:hypothetical protein